MIKKLTIIDSNRKETFVRSQYKKINFKSMAI